MKHLEILYDGHTLFDGDVEELQWSDSSDGVQVVGKYQRQQNFLEKLAAQQQQKMAAAQQQKNGMVQLEADDASA